jgi:FixJ family two-component response regulator
MIESRPLVSVVDDDESVRESLPDLLQEFGFAVDKFASAEEFLASGSAARTACLILDIAMPGMSGPDLQRELARRRQKVPIVFITAHTDKSLVFETIGRGCSATVGKSNSSKQKPLPQTAAARCASAPIYDPRQGSAVTPASL